MASSRITGTNENIATGGNATRGYDLTAGELSNWEAATDNDLVTGTVSEVLEIYADASEFADEIKMDGATTNSSYFRIIRAESGSRHGGIPGTGVHLRITGNVTDFAVVDVREQNASIQDIEVSVDNSQSATKSACYASTDTNSAGTSYIGVIARAISTTSNTRRCYNIYSNSGKIINCVAIESTNAGAASSQVGFQEFNGDSATVFFNCNAHNCGIGFNEAGTNTPQIKNCLFDGNGTHISGSATQLTNYTGSTTKGVYTLEYVNDAVENFHITANDQTTMGAGTNLSGSFDDDIDVDIRSSWDIGFDEFVGAPPVVVIIPPFVFKPQIHGAGVV